MKFPLTWDIDIWPRTYISRSLTSWTLPPWLYWIPMKSARCWDVSQSFCLLAFWQVLYCRCGWCIFQKLEVLLHRVGQNWSKTRIEHLNIAILTFPSMNNLFQSSSRKIIFLSFWSFSLPFTSGKKWLSEGIHILSSTNELMVSRIKP